VHAYIKKTHPLIVLFSKKIRKSAGAAESDTPQIQAADRLQMTANC
jgi:hypothetical protein